MVIRSRPISLTGCLTTACAVSPVVFWSGVLVFLCTGLSAPAAAVPTALVDSLAVLVILLAPLAAVALGVYQIRVHRARIGGAAAIAAGLLCLAVALGAFFLEGRASAWS